MISDNNHISYSAEDIKRYWKGQLSPKDMHAMEKAALDDPFLADAMEGMGLALEEHDEEAVTTELGNLKERFKTRVHPNPATAPVRSFRWWQVAAAALVIVVAGYWLFTNKAENKETAAVAKNDEAPAPTQPVPAKTADALSSSDTTALNDSIGITSGVVAAEKSEPGFHEFKTPTQKNNSDSLRLRQANPPASQQLKNLEGKTPGVQTLPVQIDNVRRAEQKPELDRFESNNARPPVNELKFDSSKSVTEVVRLPADLIPKPAVAAKELEEVKLQNIVSGVVTDNKNNPLANANIRLDDTNAFTTDPSGSFKIPARDSVINVSVSLPGYATQNFRLRRNFSNAGNTRDNQIQLQPSNAQLNEVVIVGYGSMKKAKGKADDAGYPPTALVQNAQPVNGWLAYEKYLETNKKLPPNNPNLVGEVVLSFNVSKRGELSGFKVEKSLSAQHDAEALRLVREGPAWKLRSGRKTRITVIVRF